MVLRLFNNTSGDENTAIGKEALSNSTGTATQLWYKTLENNTTGSDKWVGQ